MVFLKKSIKKEQLTLNSSQTRKIARIWAEDILKAAPNKKSFIINLEGDLGSGKTTFLQGFARGLGIKEKILSPTFVILKKFKITKNKNINQKFKTFYHLDCYRIKKSKEILDLGFKEIISNPQNIIAIEWAERIKKIMPKSTIWIKFKFVNEKIRRFIIFKT